MPTIVLLLAAYLIGSISFAVIVSKLFGLPDPRSYGSGNPGATNVLRTGKKAAAALTLLGDAAKGWLALFLAQRFAPEWQIPEIAVAGAGVAVFVGHLFPVFFGFKGGKGVATALGILLATSVWLGLAVMATWLLVFAMSRLSSLSALTAAGLAPIYASQLVPPVHVGMSILLSVLLIWRHRSNIQKLLAGKESGFGKSRPQDAPPQ
jgi:glycerol-3-phosphate acyltransferase PlsY